MSNLKSLTIADNKKFYNLLSKLNKKNNFIDACNSFTEENGNYIFNDNIFEKDIKNIVFCNDNYYDYLMIFMYIVFCEYASDNISFKAYSLTMLSAGLEPLEGDNLYFLFSKILSQLIDYFKY